MPLKIKDYVEKILNPKVQADGGYITVHHVDEQKLVLYLHGECSKCNISQTCLTDWITNEIKRELGYDIVIETVKKPPYFWDK